MYLLFNRSAHSAGPGENRTRKTVLRARGTLFWPKTAREPTKIDETKAIRWEIARGIRFDRSQGPEMHKMGVFSIFTEFEVALQVPSSWGHILTLLDVILVKSTHF